jgi:hypothetical protein
VRAYIRHPSEFPIELCSVEQNAPTSRVEQNAPTSRVEQNDPAGRQERLLDVSVGGLCCLSHTPYAQGDRITVRIPVGEPPFEAEGMVAWCRPDVEARGSAPEPNNQRRYRIGIAFDDASLAFSARMVEQVCHIGRYHKYLREQGREVSEDEAAIEWIGKYGKVFPR